MTREGRRVKKKMKGKETIRREETKRLKMKDRRKRVQ